jgi:hypothetical protein
MAALLPHTLPTFQISHEARLPNPVLQPMQLDPNCCSACLQVRAPNAAAGLVACLAPSAAAAAAQSVLAAAAAAAAELSQRSSTAKPLTTFALF